MVKREVVIKIVGNKILIPLIGNELKCVYCKRYVLDDYGIGVERKTYLTGYGIVCSDCYRYKKIKILHIYKPDEYPYWYYDEAS